MSQPRSGTHFLGNLLDLNDRIIFDAGQNFNIRYNKQEKRNIEDTIY